MISNPVGSDDAVLRVNDSNGHGECCPRSVLIVHDAVAGENDLQATQSFRSPKRPSG